MKEQIHIYVHIRDIYVKTKINLIIFFTKEKQRNIFLHTNEEKCNNSEIKSN